jgi:hypothetical protein
MHTPLHRRPESASTGTSGDDGPAVLIYAFFDTVVSAMAQSAILCPPRKHQTMGITLSFSSRGTGPCFAN